MSSSLFFTSSNPSEPSAFLLLERLYYTLSYASKLPDTERELYIQNNMTERELCALYHMHMKYTNYNNDDNIIIRDLFLGQYVRSLRENLNLQNDSHEQRASTTD